MESFESNFKTRDVCPLNPNLVNSSFILEEIVTQLHGYYKNVIIQETDWVIFFGDYISSTPWLLGYTEIAAHTVTQI